MPNSIKEVPWHNCQYASLPEIYIQNASLEIAWTSVISNKSNISGSIVTPFFTEEFEGFDINKEKDWLLAQYYIDNNLAKLPNINMPPFTDNQ